MINYKDFLISVQDSIPLESDLNMMIVDSMEVLDLKEKRLQKSYVSSWIARYKRLLNEINALSEQKDKLKKMSWLTDRKLKNKMKMKEKLEEDFLMAKNGNFEPLRILWENNLSVEYDA